MNLFDLSLFRRTAAEITAAAVFELFPQVEVLGGRETSSGFFCDLFFPHLLHPQTLSMIEERIRQIVRERRPVKSLEMVPFSARELLKSLGFGTRAEELEGEGLVEIVQIGSFHNLSPGPHLKNTAELAAFKLLSIEPLEGKAIRIQGCAAASKDELKEFLKKRDLYASRNHQKLGDGLWMALDDRIVWKGAGLRLRNRLIEFLKKQLFSGAAEVAGPFDGGKERSGFHEEIAKRDGLIRVAEVWTRSNEAGDPDSGLFESPEEGVVQVSSFCQAETAQQELISSLQSIGKMLTMLGFNYRLRLVGRKRTEKGFLEFLGALEKLGWEAQVELAEENAGIDFLVEDALARSWPAAAVKRIATKEKGTVPFFIAASVEKITALLIERYLLKMNCEELIEMLTEKMVQN